MPVWLGLPGLAYKWCPLPLPPPLNPPWLLLAARRSASPPLSLRQAPSLEAPPLEAPSAGAPAEPDTPSVVSGVAAVAGAASRAHTPVPLEPAATTEDPASPTRSEAESQDSIAHELYSVSHASRPPARLPAGLPARSLFAKRVCVQPLLPGARAGRRPGPFSCRPLLFHIALAAPSHPGCTPLPGPLLLQPQQLKHSMK